MSSDLNAVRDAKTILLTTYKRDGTPVQTPVSIAFEGDRAFKTAYGIAPSDYQRQLRMAQARRLIARGTSISQAAAETGFADQSHLTRWFIRYYGITPGTYRHASPL